MLSLLFVSFLFFEKYFAPLFLRDLDLSLRNKNLGNQLEKFGRQFVVLF